MSKEDFKASHNDLMQYHQRGLIPGPEETLKTFLRRVEETEKKIETPCQIDIFGIKVDWAAVYKSQKKLPFWEGGSTWIEENEEGIRSCSIHLKPFLLSRLYCEQEILSHEMVHAARMMFDEPRFEEILAFHTSKNLLRRYWGPLFSFPFESLLFVIFLCIGWIGYTAAIFFEQTSEIGHYSLCLPGIWLLFCAGRLWRSQWLFSKALKNIKKATKIEGNKALGAMLYLTDQEIKSFATNPWEEIWIYAKKQEIDSFRWKQLISVYF